MIHEKNKPYSALISASIAFAQDSIEWYTRYTSSVEITAENFESMEVVWEWGGATFEGYSGRSTPGYSNATLYTVSGPCRHVGAIDLKTGETLWSFRLPNTGRWEYSMCASYGKGIIHTEIDGKGVVIISPPGFLLVALDAKAGKPLKDWG